MFSNILCRHQVIAGWIVLFCDGSAEASPSRSSSQENDNDDTTYAASSVAAQSGPAAGDSLGPLRRRRASMQDALDFTKINASLYERPVSWLSLSVASVIIVACCATEIVSQKTNDIIRS